VSWRGDQRKLAQGIDIGRTGSRFAGAPGNKISRRSSAGFAALTPLEDCRRTSTPPPAGKSPGRRSDGPAPHKLVREPFNERREMTANSFVVSWRSRPSCQLGCAAFSADPNCRMSTSHRRVIWKVAMQ